MEVGLRQEQKLKQAMTKELRQSIELLRYTTDELQHFLQETALENPLIEIKDTPSYEQQSFFRNNQQKDQEFQDSTLTLQEDLLRQAVYSSCNEVEQKILQYLILSLDENGYLLESLEDIAEYFSISIECVENTLMILQSFEPAGIGARSLSECLLLQLEGKEDATSLTKAIIKDHLSLAADKNWEEIAGIENVSVREVQEAFQIIQTLHPKPANMQKAQNTDYVIPDLFIEKIENEFFIHLNPRAFPEIDLSRDYEPIFDKYRSSKIEGAYLLNKYKQLKWIKNGLVQRKHTILLIMRAIIKKQHPFFETQQPLLPLTLREISNEVGCHISTVSRATKGKYVQLSRGTYELKYFFPSSIQKEGGGSISSDVIKHMIKELVAKENHDIPYSDQQMVDYFSSKDIKVSRRTIAKYRKEFKIPSSAKRKRR